MHSLSIQMPGISFYLKQSIQNNYRLIAASKKGELNFNPVKMEMSFPKWNGSKVQRLSNILILVHNHIGAVGISIDIMSLEIER